MRQNIAAVFFLTGIYLLITLVTCKFDSFVWTHATKESIDMFFYSDFFYCVPSLLVYAFGWISTWYVAGYCFFVSYVLFWYPFFAVFERIIAGGVNLFLMSILLSTHATWHKCMPMQGGVIGYKWSTVIADHVTMQYILIQLLFIACCMMMIRFSWITNVKRLIKNVLLRIQHFLPVRLIVRVLYTIFYVGVMPVVKFVVNQLLLFKVALHKKYRIVSEKAAFNEYKKMISEIHAYVMLSFNVKNSIAIVDHADTTLSLVLPVTENNKNSVSQKDEGTSDNTLDVYQPIPSLFFDIRSDNQLMIVLQKEVKEKAIKLEEKLKRFGVSGTIINTYIGPLVTVFEYEPHVDTKLSKIVTLEDDLAMVLQAMSVRILAPIPGKSVVGFEVSNTQRQAVWFKELFVSKAYQDGTHTLPLILGTDTTGKEIVVNLAAMPHLLIAGSTGSGKSVALNSMLVSLLSKKSFHDMKLILIDPKRLEFMSYAHIPHLIFPIVTHPKKAVDVLKWLVQEMDRRYEKMSEIGVRDCQEYNTKKHSTQEAFPLIVVIVDEFADLMITVKKDIEDLITRIAQMARAAGIHMIIATQRPSVDVITGLIKVNFTSRIALRVASKIDSRTILDTNGAERLLAKGDMLFLDGTVGQLKRIHGPYISSQEIERVVKHVSKQGSPAYYDLDIVLQNSIALHGQEDSVLYQQVLVFIQHTDKISISLLQRQFRIGYNRSARIIEALEHNGLIMPADGSKVRRIIR